MILISTRVAIASSDGKFVNQHFGRAQQFLIVDINEDGSYDFIELRKNAPACHAEGHDSSMEDTINLISDCEGVLVSQVGPGAADNLISRGIQPIIIPMLIEDAIKTVYKLMKENNDEE
ncbi:MAG: NifB/NifX family molybdenum-iron cluster-binding protein [Methanobacterium sp.]